MEGDGNEPASGSKKKADSANGGMSNRDLDRRIVRGTKTPEIPGYERKNWLIHLHYVRKDFGTCKVLIQELLDETDGMCEFALYILGLIYRQEGDIQMSFEQFQKAAHLNPSNPANKKQVARSLFLQGKHKSAMENYGEAAIMNPKDWELLHNQGVCCVYLKDLDKAIELFRVAIEISPQTVSFKQLGRVYLKKGAVEDAIEIYKRAIKYSPEDPELLTTLGLLYLETERTQKAFDCLGKALTFDLVNPQAILAAGALIQNHGDFDVALTKYRGAADSMPESPQLWNNIGMCFYGKQKYVAAISCLKRASYLAPLEWKILYNLGLAHLSMEQYASAFHFLRAAVGCKPTSNLGQIEMLIAIALSHLEDLSNAQHMYQEALKHDKNDPLISLNYAVFCQNNGESKEARAHYKMFERKRRALKEEFPQETIELIEKLTPVFVTGMPKKAKSPPTKKDPAPTETEEPPPYPGRRERHHSVIKETVHDL